MPKHDYGLVGFFRIQETGHEIRIDNGMVHFAYGDKKTGKDLITFCGIAGNIPEQFIETINPLTCRICREYQIDHQIIMWDGVSNIDWDLPTGYRDQLLKDQMDKTHQQSPHF